MMMLAMMSPPSSIATPATQNASLGPGAVRGISSVNGVVQTAFRTRPHDVPYRRVRGPAASAPSSPPVPPMARITPTGPEARPPDRTRKTTIRARQPEIVERRKDGQPPQVTVSGDEPDALSDV